MGVEGGYTRRGREGMVAAGCSGAGLVLCCNRGSVQALPPQHATRAKTSTPIPTLSPLGYDSMSPPHPLLYTWPPPPMSVCASSALLTPHEDDQVPARPSQVGRVAPRVCSHPPPTPVTRPHVPHHTYVHPPSLLPPNTPEGVVDGVACPRGRVRPPRDGIDARHVDGGRQRALRLERLQRLVLLHLKRGGYGEEGLCRGRVLEVEKVRVCNA